MLAHMLLHDIHQHLLLHTKVLDDLLLHKWLELVAENSLVHKLPLDLPFPKTILVRRDLCSELASCLGTFFVGETGSLGGGVELDRDKLAAGGGGGLFLVFE